MKRLLFFLLISSISASAFAQVLGCTDSRASNFNPKATIDDGSCTYPLAVANPELVSELPRTVHETSGLFFYDGKLFTHNDSGGKPILYALDTSSFEIIQKITLSNAKNKDWEDVCFDGTTVFVGDFGNNKGSRKHLRIYTFPVRDIPKEGNVSVTVDTIEFVFEDQTNFNSRLVHDYDCEAMFATDRYLYLFSKGWKTGTTRMYRLEKKPGHQVAKMINWFDSKGLITGADYNKELNVIALVGYVNQIWEPFLYILYDFDEETVTAHGRRIDLPNHWGMQMEGITFFDNYRCYISAESTPVYSMRVFAIDFKRWIQE